VRACTAAGAEALLDAGENGPQLKPLSSIDLGRLEIHTQLATWLRELCSTLPLAITVDDIEGVDAPSLVVLTELASDAQQLAFVLVAALDASAKRSVAPAAIEVLKSCAHTLVLAPLRPDDMLELTRSVFGEVQHLDVLGAALSRVSAGRPRVAMEMLQHLVESGHISYRAGQWTLPPVLGEADLPPSAESALEAELSATR